MEPPTRDELIEDEGMARDQINAFLGAGTVYEGKLSFQGSVRIDGEFHGEIKSEGTLVVGKDARLEGVFNVGELLLSGTISGEVTATKKAVLNKQSHFLGTLHAPCFVVEEGADMQGNVNMDRKQDLHESDSGNDREKGDAYGEIPDTTDT